MTDGEIKIRKLIASEGMGLKNKYTGITGREIYLPENAFLTEWEEVEASEDEAYDMPEEEQGGLSTEEMIKAVIDMVYSKFEKGTWTKPIPHTIGMEVREGYVYECQGVTAQAIKTGIPYGMTDAEYFKWTP